MTGNDGADADDALLAELFDTLLQDLQDGRQPDAAKLLPDRPDLAARVRETLELAGSVTGRREPGRPVLGGYEIVRELGRGGMGTVYLARHEALGREVAIKVLPQSLALSARAKRRFLEEARSLARLRHEHVVHIHRIVDHEEMLAFEMEYVEGPSLQHLLVELRKCGPRPQREQLAALLGPAAIGLGVRSPVDYFVRLGIAIARALGEVHRRGLVHRDVKPSNILLRKNGTPVLADFGLAQDGDMTTTQTAAFAGTPIYAAPERLRHGDLGLDSRADVYSLGVTLYEAISLSPPYQGRSTEELLRKIESGVLVPLRKRAPHVSSDLQTVLQKAMETEPRDRYASADAFADDLERLLALQPVHARPKSPLRRLTLACTRHRKILIAAVASAAIVALSLWPVIAHAQSEATATERAERSTHLAHLALLRPECLDFSNWEARDHAARVGVDAEHRVAALRSALAEYDLALAATPDAADLRRERAVVATVLLLQSSLQDRSAAHPGDAAALAAATEQLPTLTRRAAGMLVDGDIDLQHLRPGLAAADADDRFVLGLLAALVGERATCEAAWDSLDAETFAHPLLDAGLGRLLAADGFAERAYPRLFHAHRAFPEAPGLRLSLADAALAAGDLDQAQQWLDQAGTPPEPNGADALRARLLAADLLVAKGDRASAERAYREILAAWPADVEARHRLATLAADHGDLVRARMHLLRVVAERPDKVAAHVDLARIALHQGARADFLVEARYALANGLGRDLSRGAKAGMVEILRLGGLRDLCDELAGHGEGVRRDWRRIEPASSLWRSPADLANMQRALRLQADFDVARAQIPITHPTGAAMFAAYAALMANRGILTTVPYLARVGLYLGLPQLILRTATPLLERGWETQRVLGTPLQRTRGHLVARSTVARSQLEYAQAMTTVGYVDGTEDLLVSVVPRRDTTGTGYVEVRAAAGDILRTTLWAPRSGLMFGYSLADIGDVDGDDIRDFAVGAPQSRNDPEVAAAVFVYSGRDHHLLRELRSHDGVAFGTAVAGLGDVDGDGTPDLAVGSAPFRRTAMALGSVVVFSGRTGAVIRELYCDRAGANFGGALANAGDVDGDHVDDLVVGGSLGGSAPLVRIYSGRTGAVLTSLDQSFGNYDFGRCVLGIGDIDHDGAGDLAVGAPGIGCNDGVPGRVLLFSGATGAPLGEFVGDAPNDRFGTSICTLPDWRGDGSPAIAVSATHGGISGNGYARVLDLASKQPLQTFFQTPSLVVFGARVACLGDHESLGRPRLAVAGADATTGSVFGLWFSLDQPSQDPAAEVPSPAHEPDQPR